MYTLSTDTTGSIEFVRVSGVLTLDEVERWAAELDGRWSARGHDRPFVAVIDIRGYEVADQDRTVHQHQRVIIPTLLARHGFEVGFFRLLEEPNTIPADPSRARVIAVAHVHHDASKMARYAELLGTENERFFTDPNEAERWARSSLA
jgi:hypothetical protein